MRGTNLFALAVVWASLTPLPAHAATRAYFVEPKTATSAWSPYQGWVGQSFRANVDSIYYIEWFVGELSARIRGKPGDATQVSWIDVAEQKPGYYSLVWDRTDNRGRAVGCGIYFCCMAAPGYEEQKKVVLVR